VRNSAVRNNIHAIRDHHTSEVLRKHHPGLVFLGSDKLGSIDWDSGQGVEGLLSALDGKLVGIGNLLDPREVFELAATLESDPVEAWLRSKTVTSDVRDLQAATLRAAQKLAKFSEETEDQEYRDTIAAKSANLFYAISSDAPLTHPVDLYTNLTAELKVLQGLDGGLAFADGEETIETRRQDIARDIEKYGPLVLLYDKFFRESEPEAIDQYVAIWLAEGDEAAIRFLLRTAR